MRIRAENFFKDLEDRGIVHSVTNKEHLINALTLDKKVYLGIDPTASSLHLGHYFGLTLLNRFLKKGYKAVLLIGGATALIGDPSFRSKERPILSLEEIKNNIDSIIGEIIDFFKNKVSGIEIVGNSPSDLLEKWVDFSETAGKFKSIFQQHGIIEESFAFIPILDALSTIESWSKKLPTLSKESNSKRSCPLLIINNERYYRDLTSIDLIKDVCKYVNVNEFLHKDFLKDRLSSGLTGSEFLYPICQAWDFYRLCKEENVYIQLGGSDQWGNIVAGLSFLKKKYFFEDNQSKEDEVSGLTFPLLIDSHGKKFGKSEGNALFLNPKKTNPIDVYQYLRRLDDNLAAKYLLMLTDVNPEEVEERKKLDPKEASLQKQLALYVCEDIYGTEIAKDLKAKCEFLYSSGENLDFENKELLGDWSFTYSSILDGIPIIKVLTDLKLSKSNSEARRLIEQKSILVEGQLIEDANYLIKKLDNQNYIRIQKGKKERRIIYFE